MKKKIVLFFTLVGLCNILLFPREKIKENTEGILYRYTDWNEFYENLISSSKKTTYKYAYLFNGSDESFFGEHDFNEVTDWVLVSA